MMTEEYSRKLYSEAYETLQQTNPVDLVEELWLLGMALSIIAKWKVWRLPWLHRFNRRYIEAWVLRTATILTRTGNIDLAISMLRVESHYTHPNARLLKAARILGNNPSVKDIMGLQFIEADK